MESTDSVTRKVDEKLNSPSTSRGWHCSIGLCRDILVSRNEVYERLLACRLHSMGGDSTFVEARDVHVEKYEKRLDCRLHSTVDQYSMVELVTLLMVHVMKL